MMKDYDYNTPYIGAKYRIVIFVVFSFGGVLGLLLGFNSLPHYISVGDTKQIIAGIFFGIPFMVYTLSAFTIPFALEWWKVNFYADLTDDSVIGYNLWRKPTEVKYTGIVEIYNKRIYRFVWLRPNIILKTSSGDELRFHINIENLTELIREIEKRCPNIKSIDYGILKDDERIWRTGPKQMLW